ncbi:hypothetical protein TraAM80_02260 [Trypanosoma rangeli]|uniref:RING-type domain-containing protein n=1 Tax=Trypanosoma rangeli TaxID=5698 RepID=A0A422NV09_TRYRA|nr:uncharacterized protein TraAM80_02260 [Trypanosoma rangeli]RNF09313.1 hypothetical protein TraAM80_02260 [Trypanosoma rangeli]|eukprot:RNF09313.1 hypothetical protein TraAM80_02260 [Trypanosoma rangeli]
MPIPGGIPAITQHTSVWAPVRSDNSAFTTAGGGHGRRNSDSLPVIGSPANCAKETVSMVQSVNTRSAEARTKAELLQVIEQQRNEMQARTDSVNAIQRNFERLSEMYRGDHAELEQLREEVKRLREREGSEESEQKVHAAVRAELESLLKSHKKLQEVRQQEQQTFRSDAAVAEQQMESQLRLFTQLQGECDELRRVKKYGEEKLERATADLGYITRHVLQFLEEVRCRVASLSVEKITHRRGDTALEDGDAKQTVKAALADAWDSVDAVCIGLRTAHASMNQMAQERVERCNAVVSKVVQELEKAMRVAVSEGEAAARDALHAQQHNHLHGIRRQTECLLLEKAQEELTVAHRKLQLQERAHDTITSDLRRQAAELNARLQTTQEDYDTLLLQHQTDVTTLGETLQQQMLQLREEMRQLKELHAEEAETQQRQHECEQEKLGAQYAAALRQALESTAAEYETKHLLWRDRIDKIGTKLCRLATMTRAAHNQVKEVRVKNTATCDLLHTSLALVKGAHHETLLRSEAEAREDLMELERVQRESLLLRSSDHCKALSTTAKVTAQLSLAVSLNVVVADESAQRLAIMSNAWTTSPAVACERALHKLWLQEERRLAPKMAYPFLPASLAEMRVQLQELRQTALGVSQCMHDMQQEQAHLFASTLERAQQLGLSWMASTVLLHQKWQKQQDGQGRAIAALRAVMEMLMAAEGATESLYSCGLCMQLYRNPVTCVPCGHTFCKSCLLLHPENKARGKGAASYCPECGLASCSSLVHVRALDTLSGNFSFRRKGVEELQRALEALTAC